MAQRRTIAQLGALLKAYFREWVWKATDIRKYSFVNRTIKNWNQLAAEGLGSFPSKPKFLERDLAKQL
jgi:hypothetical protein